MNFDPTFTVGNVIELVGVVGMAIGVYLGIKLDLTRLHEESTTNATNIKAAHDLAADAHALLYKHVSDLHTNNRYSNRE